MLDLVLLAQLPRGDDRLADVIMPGQFAGVNEKVGHGVVVRVKVLAMEPPRQGLAKISQDPEKVRRKFENIKISAFLSKP